MLFMVMHKVDAAMEAAVPPDSRIIAERYAEILGDVEVDVREVES